MPNAIVFSEPLAQENKTFLLILIGNHKTENELRHRKETIIIYANKNVQASLCIRAVLSDRMLFCHVSDRPRETSAKELDMWPC